MVGSIGSCRSDFCPGPSASVNLFRLRRMSDLPHDAVKTVELVLRIDDQLREAVPGGPLDAPHRRGTTTINRFFILLARDA